mgnify:CR=1 FL=1
MKLQFRPWQKTDLSQMTRMWNDILTDGDAFPGTELYEEGPFGAYLGEQTAATCLLLEGALAGYYILHPNNIGRCGHVANASYVLDRAFRGRGLGRPLVERSLEEAAALGFRGMQFNAVVKENRRALHLYEKLGFQHIGEVPGGFLMKDGHYADIVLFYYVL